jgi:hypothetical protein
MKRDHDTSCEGTFRSGIAANATSAASIRPTGILGSRSGPPRERLAAGDEIAMDYD